MLSNKWTFSLTSLVVLIAFGLVCAVPSAFADGDANVNHYDIGVAIAAGETMVDVSAKDGFQIATGRDRSTGRPVFVAGSTVAITFTVTFSKGTINLFDPDPTLDVIADEIVLTSSEDAFGLDDLFVEAFDREGRSLGAFSLADVALTAAPVVDTASLTAFQDAGAIGRKFLVRIDETQIANAYVDARGGTFEIYKLSFFMPRAIAGKAGGRRIVATAHYGVKNAALDHFAASFDSSSDADKDNSHAHYNGASNVFTLDLVDDDEGDANYRRIVTNSAIETLTVAADENISTGSAAAGRPGVVAIIQSLDRTAFQPIVTGPFNVRIILTEEPKDGLTTDLIEVVNGTAMAVTKGLSLKGAHAEVAGVRDAQDSELKPDFINYYYPGDGGVDDGDPVLITPTTTPVTGYDTRVRLPEATGRDNMYHQYTAVIEPNAGIDGYVTVSIKGFADNVLPVSKMYVPLASTQRDATVLSGVAEAERNARLANESAMVRVKTVADTTSTGALAKAAYETRSDDDADDADGKGKNGVYDLNLNVKPLGGKLVVPAGGFLVLVGDAGKASILASSAKTAEKITPASKLYNITGLGLPFPADDLDNFFRNGGSLSLVYQDITAATGSGTDESKGATGADATGYTAATTDAHAKGALIINEIMWGLDAGGKDSQYIELHNPGATAVTIDHLEWAIAVGTAPTGFTVIDEVSNNPATGYWAPPGNGGVTAASAENPTVIDLVSMSRIGDDGTAAASWAASMRPSANLSGRRVGTAGAANVYVMPAAEPETETEPVTPAAAVATAADIMITEIMVASDNGRLPQWIELSNVSAAAVSLTGWSLEIENDSADTDVVGAGDTIVIDLGDVEIGADQVALVVSKSGRNSGVGDGDGDLREDRIIDVQSAVSPTNARYRLISEMGFKISLIPPGAGAVRKPGDVAGNLDDGWELPASEGDDRSSLIRREMDNAAMATMGTDAAGWVLASSTGLSGAYRATYYGDADDVGTPGYDAGGALPVELSAFNAGRDRVTGAVVITWSTQSELNNAGFFIKRSQQTNGKFVIVNPTMIAGAGTTAEKQSYTYTDATADPNVIYYYQIEDVSLDGNRQTLTRAHRLKGHIGAAGKATRTWGELKSSRD